MQESQRVPTAQAARELGLAQETVRYFMETGQLRIGKVVKSRSGKSKRYLIFRPLLDKELGKDGSEA